MHFKITPDQPRQLSRCGAMVAAGQDLRWRGFGVAGTKITSGSFGKQGGHVPAARRHEAQQRSRTSGEPVYRELRAAL